MKQFSEAEIKNSVQAVDLHLYMYSLSNDLVRQMWQDLECMIYSQGPKVFPQRRNFHRL